MSDSFAMFVIKSDMLWGTHSVMQVVLALSSRKALDMLESPAEDITRSCMMFTQLVWMLDGSFGSIYR